MRFKTLFIHPQSERFRARILTICALLFFVISWAWFYDPLARTLESRLSMNPIEWNYLQNAIQLAKSKPAEVLVPQLSDEELGRLKMLSKTKGIHFSVLHLQASNPPQLEVQANNVSFAAWVDLLNEYRTQWHIYPVKAEVLSEASAGMVSISATFQQAEEVSR
jgi:type II secretory pathway component PulM